MVTWGVGDGGGAQPPQAGARMDSILTKGNLGITVEPVPGAMNRWWARVWQDGQVVAERYHNHRRMAIVWATERLIRMESRQS